jgi:hypothetical protein
LQRTSGEYGTSADNTSDEKKQKDYGARMTFEVHRSLLKSGMAAFKNGTRLRRELADEFIGFLVPPAWW